MSCCLSGLSPPSPGSGLFSQIIQGTHSLLLIMNNIQNGLPLFMMELTSEDFLTHNVGKNVFSILWIILNNLRAKVGSTETEDTKSISIFIPTHFLMGQELMNYRNTGSSWSEACLDQTWILEMQEIWCVKSQMSGMFSEHSSFSYYSLGHHLRCYPEHIRSNSEMLGT